MLLTIYASDDTSETYLICVLLAVKVIPWVEFAVRCSSNSNQHLFQRFVQGEVKIISTDCFRKWFRKCGEGDESEGGASNVHHFNQVLMLNL